MGLLLAEQRKQAKLARKLVKSSNLAMHVGSVALAIEALELLLVEKGLLGPDELMNRIRIVTTEHYAKGQFIPPEAD